VCGELLIFDTNQQFATHRLGGLEKSNTFEAGMTAISKIKEQRATPGETDLSLSVRHRDQEF